MSVVGVLSVFDDDALVALTSKGLVRRAARDYEKQKFEIIDTQADVATFTVDNEQVVIDEKGPESAKCTCSAAGVCRHVLTAIMALRDTGADMSAGGDANGGEEPSQNVMEEIIALASDAVQKFAGADYEKALKLADTSAESKITKSATNLTVELSGSPASVTFVAGQPLKKALYKGPVTKQRLVIAAAAIIVRRSNSVFDGPAAPAGASTGSLSKEFLQETGEAIKRAMAGVLINASPLASETFFNLGISARAEASPRLASQLRSLSAMAALAPGRHVDFQADRFLVACARCFALCQSLQTLPDDPRLTGVLKREFHEGEAEDLIVVGARKWRTANGARGLTTHFVNTNGQWRSTTTARGGGQDPSFSPSMAYEGSLWTAGPPSGLMGKIVQVPQVRLADDGSIAETLRCTVSVQGRAASLDDLREPGVVYTNWQALNAWVHHQAGRGLRRVAQPIPALIEPSKFAGLGFNELQQCHELEAVDSFGQTLVLRLVSEDAQDIHRLRATSLKNTILLISVEISPDGMFATPVSILTESDGMKVFNIGLDNWWHHHRSKNGITERIARKISRRLSKTLGEKIAPLQPVKARMPDLLERLAATIIDESLNSFPHSDGKLSRFCEKAQAAGLTLLADQLRLTDGKISPETLMKIAYLADEARLARLQL